LESQKESDHLEDKNVGWWIILRCILDRRDMEQTGWGVVDWIGLVQEKDKWKCIVNTVINFRFP
jgi:hypothetical protein